MADVRVFKDIPHLVAAAAQRVVDQARDAIAARGVFTVGLAGGSTPRALYDLLATPAYQSLIEWERVEVLFGDERCVPPDHPESNFKMAHEALLSRVPVNAVHRMEGELDPEEAARRYGKLLKVRFGDWGSPGPDLTLLGMGTDGHTASLFPFSPAIDETRHRCVAQFVEQSTTGPGWRITLTPPMLNASRQIVVLITGAAKAAKLQEALDGPRDSRRLPIQLLDLAKTIWMRDDCGIGFQPM